MSERTCSRCGVWYTPPRPKKYRCPRCDARAADAEAQRLARREYDRLRNRPAPGPCSLCGRDHLAELEELETKPSRRLDLDAARRELAGLRVLLDPDREDRAGDPIVLGSED